MGGIPRNSNNLAPKLLRELVEKLTFSNTTDYLLPVRAAFREPNSTR